MTNVLVVDDDNDTVDVLCEYLKLKGMNVVGSAKNGQEALKLYKELKPDIVLLDVWMPDFDGYFGLQKIREFDPDAKVVMVTASAFSDSKKNKLKSMGASDVICKPYETSDVIKTIEEQTTGVVSKPTS
jgi:DNA-binding response OmpR family regulator